MTANDGAMVREAIRAYRAGSKAEARALLEKAVEANQYNEQAWLWLSAVVESPAEQRTCLENVLVINPDNDNAKQGIAMLDKTSGSAPPAARPAQPAEEDPFADLDFPADSSSPASNPFASTAPAPASDMAEPPTASSSASSVYNPANEPSSSDYDNWMDSLDIGSQSPPVSAPATAFGGSLEDDFSFLDDADSSPRAPASPPAYNDQDFEDTFDDIFGEESSASVSGPFGADVLGDDMDFLDEVESGSARPVAKSMMSPGRESSAREDLLAGLASDLAGGDFITDYDPDDFDEPDPSEYFRSIPKNISVTRLPGTIERTSPILLVGMVVLIIANIGALGLILSKIAG